MFLILAEVKLIYSHVTIAAMEGDRDNGENQLEHGKWLLSDSVWLFDLQ